MKDINDIFDPDNADITEIELDEVSVHSNGTTIDITEDYSFVREQLIKAMIRGSELIDESVKEAKTSPTARAIEAASASVKTLTDVSKSLIELHEKIRSLDKVETNDDTNISTDDGIVLKSTLTDLIKQIEESRESE